MGRGIVIALFVSVALNLVVISFAAGWVMDGKGGAPKHRPMPPAAMNDPISIFGHVRDLSPEGQKAFKETFGGHRKQMQGVRREARARRAELNEKLSAVEWDRAEVDAAMKSYLSVESGRAANTSKLLVDAFEKLSAEERVALITRYEERRKHRRRGGHRGDEEHKMKRRMERAKEFEREQEAAHEEEPATTEEKPKEDE